MNVLRVCLKLKSLLEKSNTPIQVVEDFEKEQKRRLFKVVVASALALTSIIVSTSFIGCTRSRVQSLVQEMKSPSAARRIWVAAAMGALKDPLAIPALTSALGDKDPAVRKGAAWALGQIRDPAATRALTVALDHWDKRVRVQAAAALLRNARVSASTEHQSLPPHSP